MPRLVIAMLCFVSIWNLSHTKRVNVDADAIVGDETSFSTSERNSSLGTNVASDICAAMIKLGNAGGLVTVADDSIPWYVIPTCETGRKNMFWATYTFTVVIRRGAGRSGPQVYFKVTHSKDEMKRFMVSEASFKIPIGPVLHGHALNNSIKQFLSNLFGTTTENFERKHYLLIGSISQETIVPELGVRPTRTKGFGMRPQTSPKPNGFCSFVGMIQGKRTRINSLMRHNEHYNVELQSCLDSCKTRLSPTSICLAATYDPANKWCELAIRDAGMLHDQGTNGEVVANVQSMTTRQTKEMVKIGHLVALQEQTTTHSCEECQCFVKDFEQQELVDPSPVIFIASELNSLMGSIRTFRQTNPTFSEEGCTEMYDQKLKPGSSAPLVVFSWACDEVCNAAKSMKEKWGSDKIAKSACEVMVAFGCESVRGSDTCS